MNKLLKYLINPFSLPVILFGAIIAVGTMLLHFPLSQQDQPISWLDALFTATSATCVTGLAVVDTGTFFSKFGQSVILFLIQVGGIGIMTYTSLAFFLVKRRVSMTDRVAVGQNLLHDPSFRLGSFLVQMVTVTFGIEILGAALLIIQAPSDFSLFSALFHSISAFCNAGFSLNSDSLMKFQGDWGINLIFMGLIVSGGIGFAVLLEIFSWVSSKLRLLRRPNQVRLTWYAVTVIKSTIFLIIAGWLAIYISEITGFHKTLSHGNAILASLFQSVTCRTAGFNTCDIGQMTNVSLIVMIMLMFIGGASGSTAGGIKVSSFRVMVGFIISQIKGRQQTVVGKYAVEYGTLNKALILIIISFVIVLLAIFVLNISEIHNLPIPEKRQMSLAIFFEVVSAYGTVGLSMGLTPQLTVVGKSVIILLMFIGRLGPIVIITALQSYQKKELFRWPEDRMLIG